MPAIGGHEFVGRIVEISDEAVKEKGFSIGDRVTAEQIVPCGECRYCRNGQYWLCAPHAAANGATVRAVEADAFRFLEAATPMSYDLVVVDPPSSHGREGSQGSDQGLRETQRSGAHRLCAGSPAGDLFMFAECQRTRLRAHSRRSRQAGPSRVRVVEAGGPGGDHPLPPAFGEGQH